MGSKQEINVVIDKLKSELHGQKQVLSGEKIPPIADELLKKVDQTFDQNGQYSTEVSATSSAYETMQIGNLRLLQQLREKNATNFPLKTKQIRMQSMLRLSEEERLYIQQHIKTLKALTEQQ